MLEALIPSAPRVQLNLLKSSLEPRDKASSGQLVCPALDTEVSAKIPSSTLTLRDSPHTRNRGNEGEEHPWGFTPGSMLQGEGSCLLDQVIPHCC